ncbi:hypothetical protein ABZ769_10520 [Streptomyces olivoreticuli]
MERAERIAALLSPGHPFDPKTGVSSLRAFPASAAPPRGAGR